MSSRHFIERQNRNVWYAAFLPQITDLTVTRLCCTGILVNLLPFGQNSSGVLFSSVSSALAARGTLANWHHTGIQDL